MLLQLAVVVKVERVRERETEEISDVHIAEMREGRVSQCIGA